MESLLIRSPEDRELKYQLAQCQTNLALSIAKTSLTEAENIYRSVASRAAELVADDPGNPEYRGLQQKVLGNLGLILPSLGRSPEAEGILRQAVTIEEGLVRDFPQVPKHQDRLANSLNSFGIVLHYPKRVE